MRGAAKLWATTQWRRQWPTLVLACLVLALTGALALGAATGARRAASAFERLREQTAAADVQINDIDLAALGGGVTNAEALERLLPLIDAEAATIEERFFIFPIGTTLFPNFDYYPIVQRQLLDNPANVPAVVAGRLPHPTEIHEVALSQQFASLLGVDVGDSLTVESATLAWIEASFSTADPGPKDGPTLELDVTGIVVSPLDFAAPSGTMYLTTAFGDEYGGKIGNFPGANLRIGDEARVAEMIRTGSPNTGDEVIDAAFHMDPSAWGDRKQVGDGLRVVAVALWIFAGTVAFSGLATVALIIRRLARSSAADIEVLSALGLGRLGQAQIGVLLVSPVIALATFGIAIGALLLAPTARLGLADQVEPDRGVYVDWTVLPIGTTVLALAVFVISSLLFLVIGRRAEASRGRKARPAVNRPISLVLGTREAIGTRGPGRVATIAAACLMTTVVTSLIVGASLDRLPTRPDLWGGGTDVVIDFGEVAAGEPNIAYEEALSALAGDDRAEGLTGTTLFFPEIDGRPMTSFALDIQRGEPIITILAGRSPRTPDEIVMGRETMTRYAVNIGDNVEMTVAGQTESFHVVGQAAFPVGDVAGFDDSAAITSAGATRFAEFDEGNRINQVLITWASGVNHEQARADLSASGYRVLDRSRLPPAVTNLQQVDDVPELLTLFFGALGISALGYMLGASSRARRRQLSVLATLGLQRQQLASMLRWQAITTALAAALLGVPAGIIIGRVVWAAIASSAGVGLSHAISLGTLAVAVSLALLAAISIATALAARARRQRLAELLRAN